MTTINAYLAEPHGDGYYGMEFEQAMDGRDKKAATHAADIWRAIATGEASVSATLTWAQHVAKRIQAEVLDAELIGTERPRAALAAIGFRGPVDRHLAVKYDLSVYLDFSPDAGAPEALEFLQKRGHLLDMPRKVALTRIAEWRKPR